MRLKKRKLLKIKYKREYKRGDTVSSSDRKNKGQITGILYMQDIPLHYETNFGAKSTLFIQSYNYFQLLSSRMILIERI